MLIEFIKDGQLGKDTFKMLLKVRKISEKSKPWCTLKLHKRDFYHLSDCQGSRFLMLENESLG